MLSPSAMRARAPAFAWVALVVVALVAAAVSCAGMGVSKRPCKRYPPGDPEFRWVSPALILDREEAARRHVELDRRVWLDGPSGEVHPEFERWRRESRDATIRCVRPAPAPMGIGDDRRYELIWETEPGVRAGATPASVVASIPNGRWMPETPVLVRMGTTVLLKYIVITRQRDGIAGDGQIEFGNLQTERYFQTVDISGFVRGDPGSYRYLLEERGEQDRWVDKPGYVTFVILPSRGRQLDPTRPGYVVTLRPETEVRLLHIVDAGAAPDP